MSAEPIVWRRAEVMRRLGISLHEYTALVRRGMLKPRVLPGQRRKTYIPLSNLKEVEAALQA